MKAEGRIRNKEWKNHWGILFNGRSILTLWKERYASVEIGLVSVEKGIRHLAQNQVKINNLYNKLDKLGNLMEMLVKYQYQVYATSTMDTNKNHAPIKQSLSSLSTHEGI